MKKKLKGKPGYNEHTKIKIKTGTEDPVFLRNEENQVKMTNLILTSSPWLPLGAPNVPTPQPTNEMVVGTCQADIIEEKLNLFVLLSLLLFYTPGMMDVSGHRTAHNKSNPSMWEMVVVEAVVDATTHLMW